MLKELYLLWLRLAAPQELHYINGADTLPPPLPPDEERAALPRWQRAGPKRGICSLHIICDLSCTLPKSLRHRRLALRI